MPIARGNIRTNKVSFCRSFSWQDNVMDGPAELFLCPYDQGRANGPLERPATN